MEFLRILLTSIGSLALLFALTKLMGNRQMSQMSMFDYLSSITIGSIAAELAICRDENFWQPLVAMAVYGFGAAGAAWVTCKSMRLRRLFNGQPIVLFENGTLYEKNLLRAKLDINEFLTQCRSAGYFDLSQVQAAILETNGQVSFLPTAQQRPVTPADLQMQLPAEKPSVAVIIDGKVLADNLRFTGNNDVWLRAQLEKQQCRSAAEVFLATVDAQNALTVYRRTGRRVCRDMFE